MKEKQILKIFTYLRIFLIVVIVVSLINMYAFTISSVSGSSMQNTFFDRDIVFLNKIFDLEKTIDYGDVIVFVEGRSVNQSMGERFSLLLDDMKAKFTRQRVNFRMIKRVIAKDGDKVLIEGGEVFVNDVKVVEPYINQMTAKGDIEYPFVVPEGAYFVLGDNREASNDSRFFGAIDEETIEGIVAFRVFPFTRFGGIN